MGIQVAKGPNEWVRNFSRWVWWWGGVGLGWWDVWLDVCVTEWRYWLQVETRIRLWAMGDAEWLGIWDLTGLVILYLRLGNRLSIIKVLVKHGYYGSVGWV